jgi:glutamyl-tRNA synthetase
MSNPQVRVRVAPSPTGDPHLGTAYQALFNYAFAKRHGGTFILRIEDTDRARSTPASERAILDSLRWLGIPWDEGPDVGGPYAPYRQSERTGIYREHAAELLRRGRAYRCFCPRERLEALRKDGRVGYDRQCRGLPVRESGDRAAAGEPFVIRLSVPVLGDCVMHDLLRGEITKDWASVDDQVLLKTDGFPTYHLANVVDDHLMKVSHVIRGEEWLNSLPKHLHLYRSFDWEPPIFCHLPLLRNNDPNRSKLSKRKNPTSVNYYRRAGYLPEALLNFLGLMGWTMPGGEEKFTVAEMVANLELERISLGGPIFDVDKLRWLNGRYLRENYTPEGLLGALEAWSLNRERLGRIVPLVQPRLETLGDWGALTAPFFADRIALDPKDLVPKGSTEDEVRDLLQMAVWRLEADREFTAASIERTLKDMADRLQMKLRDLTAPFYVALSGSRVWTPLYDSMEVLGSDMVRIRLRRAVQALGDISEKKQKALEKRYAAVFGAGEDAS